MSSGIRIVKMSGAGNDFVVLGVEDAAPIANRLVEWTRRICRRGESVGADGVLLVESVGADRVAVRFLNPDGSRAFCGNGSRCAARFAVLRGLAGPRLTLVTDWGDVPAIVDGRRVTLELPAPVDLGAAAVRVEEREVTGRLVRAGVPHFVVAVASVGREPLPSWVPAVRRHPRFGSEGVNVDLVEGSGDELRVRTWERGVEGETRACGSGAVAAALVRRIDGGGETITVVPLSGRTLRIELPGASSAPTAARLSGDAQRIFEGLVDSEAEE